MRTKKIGNPKSALDFQWMLRAAAAIDALRNGQVVNGEDSRVIYADGNTIWQIAAGAGTGNLQFQQPYVELDPTIAVKQWTIVNVSPANPIATTGLKDLDSLITTNAPTGYWVAIVDIPAQTGTPPKYNVPVMPPSVAWTSSPGSQKGDLDQGSKWWPLPRIGSCV